MRYEEMNVGKNAAMLRSWKEKADMAQYTCAVNKLNILE